LKIELSSYRVIELLGYWVIGGYRGIVGVTVRVRDLATATRVLHAAGVEFSKGPAGTS
jgi:hypothetical protein